VPIDIPDNMLLLFTQYLQDTLGELMRKLLESTECFEVDSNLITNKDELQRHKSQLTDLCTRFWTNIYTSHNKFPTLELLFINFLLFFLSLSLSACLFISCLFF